MAQGINSENYFSWEDKFFLGQTPIPGLQSFDASFSLPIGPVSYLGGIDAVPAPRGDKSAQVNLNAILLSSDNFIGYTGDFGVNGYLIRDLNDRFNKNYSFVSGYLTSYSNQYSLGSLPQVNASFQVVYNIGKITSSTLTHVASEMQSLNYATTGIMQDFHQGCASFNIPIFGDNPLLSYSININCPRTVITPFNKDTPSHVFLSKPLQIDVELQFEEALYTDFNLKTYPYDKPFSNITIFLKNKNGIVVNRYNFGNLELMSSSKKESANSPATRTLVYRKYGV